MSRLTPSLPVLLTSLLEIHSVALLSYILFVIGRYTYPGKRVSKSIGCLSVSSATSSYGHRSALVLNLYGDPSAASLFRSQHWSAGTRYSTRLVPGF